MRPVLETIAAISMVLATGVTVVGLVLQQKVISRLKTIHTEKFAELGSPGFMSSTPAKGLRFARFIHWKEYAALDDPKLTRLGSGLRVSGFILYACFGTYVICAIMNLAARY